MFFFLRTGYRRVAQAEYGSEDEMNIMLTADPQVSEGVDWHLAL